MFRPALIAFVLVAAPAIADDDHHMAEAQGVRAIHAWTNATRAATALIYVEIENTSEVPVILTGAESEIAESGQLVGLQNAGGELVHTPIPAMPIPAHSELVLAPNGLAIRLSGLGAPLEGGGQLEIELEFEGFHLDASVEIESVSATRHSHAGHAH